MKFSEDCLVDLNLLKMTIGSHDFVLLAEDLPVMRYMAELQESMLA